MAAKDTSLPTHPVNVTVLPAKGRRERLVPDDEQRKIIAEDSDLVALEFFEAELLFRRWRKNGVSVTGTVRAKTVQECVVTLEPVNGSVEEEIDRTFVPEGSKLLRPQLSSEGEIIVDYDGRDEPEGFTGDTLDAWEIVLEHFQLGIDPFPRKAGAKFEENAPQSLSEDENNEISPFAALKPLLDKKK